MNLIFDNFYWNILKIKPGILLDPFPLVKIALPILTSIITMTPHIKYFFDLEKKENIFQMKEFKKLHPELLTHIEKVSNRVLLKFVDDNSHTAYISGINSHLNLFRRPIITVSKKFYNAVDSNVMKWVYRHELGHLYNNDLFFKNLIHTIDAFVRPLFLFFSYLYFPIGTLPAQFFLSYLIREFRNEFLFHISKRNETHADMFANSHATKMELIGGKAFFEGSRKASKKYDAIFKKILPSFEEPKNEERDPHASNRIRAKWVVQELKRRKIKIPTEKNDKNFRKMKREVYNYYLRNQLQSLKKSLERASAFHGKKMPKMIINHPLLST